MEVDYLSKATERAKQKGHVDDKGRVTDKGRAFIRCVAGLLSWEKYHTLYGDNIEHESKTGSQLNTI